MPMFRFPYPCEAITLNSAIAGGETGLPAPVPALTRPQERQDQVCNLSGLLHQFENFLNRFLCLQSVTANQAIWDW